MKLKLLILFLLAGMAKTAFSQDTTYYDANDKLVKSLALADYYKITRPDSVNPKWTREFTYYKSGKIRTDAVLSAWRKGGNNYKYEGIYKEWYESGQLHKSLEFFNGMMNGKAFSYWENGKLKHEGVYDNDRWLIGKNYHSDGSQAKDGPYRTSSEYPGGMNEFYKYVYENLTRVIQEKDSSYSGKIYLSFYINKDGSLSDIALKDKIAPWICEIAKDMFNRMPKWTPAIRDGEAYSTRLIIPIEIRTKNDKSPYILVDQMPEFPGGTEKMMEYLGRMIRYPVAAQMKKVQGMVISSFIVDKDGVISDINVVRGIGGGCDDEAVRVIKSMPTWTPGKQGGQPVPVKFTLPIRFALK
jgi:TonB family C-terminal domain